MGDVRQVLSTLAQEMLDRSYAPYSGFRVGAAVWTGEDRYHGGCNVENSSYGLTVCAERVAILRWVSDGKIGEIEAVAIRARDSDGRERTPRPCGACLQVIREFAEDPVFYFWEGETVEERRLSQLLPDPFTAGDFSSSG